MQQSQTWKATAPVKPGAPKGTSEPEPVPVDQSAIRKRSLPATKANVVQQSQICKTAVPVKPGAPKGTTAPEPVPVDRPAVSKKRISALKVLTNAEQVRTK